MISAFSQTIFFISFSNSSREPSELLSSSQTHPLYLEAHFFVLSFHLTEMRIFLENALFFLELSQMFAMYICMYISCILCIYCYPHYVCYVYILIIIIIYLLILKHQKSSLYLQTLSQTFHIITSVKLD